MSRVRTIALQSSVNVPKNPNYYVIEDSGSYLWWIKHFFLYPRSPYSKQFPSTEILLFAFSFFFCKCSSVKSVTTGSHTWEWLPVWCTNGDSQSVADSPHWFTVGSQCLIANPRHSMNRQLLRSLLAGSGGISATADRAAAPHTDHFLSGHHRTDPGRRSTKSGTTFGIRIRIMGQISIETPNPKSRKNTVLGGRCSSVWSPRSPPPLLHTVRIHVPLYLFTQGRGGGVDEPVRRLEGASSLEGSKIPTWLTIYISSL